MQLILGWNCSRYKLSHSALSRYHGFPRYSPENFYPKKVIITIWKSYWNSITLLLDLKEIKELCQVSRPNLLIKLEGSPAQLTVFVQNHRKNTLPGKGLREVEQRLLPNISFKTLNTSRILSSIFLKIIRVH